jgi:hypothetical protein
MYEPGQQIQTSGSGSALSALDRQPQPSAYGGEQMITNIVGLPFLEAFVDATGEPVTLIAACNWQGHSPADIAVSRRGKQLLASFEEVTVIDPRAVPNPQLSELRSRQIQTQQQRGNVSQGLGQLSSR